MWEPHVGNTLSTSEHKQYHNCGYSTLLTHRGIETRLAAKPSDQIFALSLELKDEYENDYSSIVCSSCFCPQTRPQHC